MIVKSSYSSTKLITSDSDVEGTFNPCIKALWQKIKNYACEDWVVLDAIIKNIIKIFECYIRRINSIKNGDNK